MMRPLITVLLICFSYCYEAQAQTCSALGQNPQTAFPVCGIQSFTQNSVTLCGNRVVPNPCGSQAITDKNPYWYKFTCYQTGTLGFLITPKQLSDDYDWQLFDVTGRLPAEIYSDKTLFVACNWSGEAGETGASDAGTSLSVCEGPGQPLFSSMPTLQEGHDYLLLISHFTETQSGYDLEFRDGTASITNPSVASMSNALGNCDGASIGIKLSKKMQCSSLAVDGSDFYLTSGSAVVISAAAPACENGFDMDSVTLTLNQPLPVGDYTIGIRKGSDGNTLMDDCAQEMQPGTTAFTVHRNVNADFVYTIATGCTQDTVIFKHDGANEVNTWNWVFDDGARLQSKEIVKFFGDGGEKEVTLEVSNGWCTAAATKVISLSAKINAAFQAPEIMCAIDNAVFSDMSTGNVTAWNWQFGNGHTSGRQNPDPVKFDNIGRDNIYTVQLQVTGESGCTDSASARVMVVSNCIIAVPSAFTPNNDGKNDQLYPSNAFNSDNLVFRVFNRFGQMVFQTRDWKNKWDGTLNGVPQGTGTYVWTLSYTLKATGKNYSSRGTTILIR